MTRLRNLSLSFIAAALLAACGDSGAPSRPAATREPAPAVVEAQADALPETEATPAWQPAVPTLSPDQVDATLARARQALASGWVEQGNSPGPGALELFLAVLAVEPANPAATQGLAETLAALQARVPALVRAGKLEEAARIRNIVATTQPDHADAAATAKIYADGRAAAGLVLQAGDAADKGRIVTPAGTSALDLYGRALERVPGFVPALDGLQRWHRIRLRSAWRAASGEDYDSADALLEEARRLRPDSGDTLVMRLRIIELRQALTDALLGQGNAAVDKLDLDQAERSHAHLARIAAQPDAAAALRQRIHLARHYGPYKPAQYFTERLAAGGRGPELVVIPYGRFTMGSPDDEAMRDIAEGPAHAVTFARGFAIARSETTVAEFRRFVAASGYRSLATREGHSTVYDEKGGLMSEHEGVDWRRDHVGATATPQAPVMHVAFEDAQAYAAWLSRQTGQVYRLPSEAEFEYALRAGNPGAYPWGDAAPGRIVGNLTGAGDQSGSGRRWANAIPGYRDGYWGAAPVRSFPAETWGTFDLTGNLSEWTLDCWHDNYQRAPADGSAWINPGCSQRVVRGASWASSLDQARSAFRLASDATTTSARLGFRVVREL